MVRRRQESDLAEPFNADIKFLVSSTVVCRFSNLLLRTEEMINLI